MVIQLHTRVGRTEFATCTGVVENVKSYFKNDRTGITIFFFTGQSKMTRELGVFSDIQTEGY